MVPIRILLEIPAPTIALIKALPEGAQLCVVLSQSQVLPVAVQVQVNCEAEQMQAVTETLARLGIQDGHPLVTGYFPESHLVPKIKGAIH